MSECIAPDELSAGDLVAYLEGAASPDTASHIARCAACAAEVTALRAADLGLTAAMFRVECPEPDDLLLYQAGLLGRRDARRIVRHIAGCRDCQLELATLAHTAERASATSLSERIRQAGKQLLRAVLSAPGQPSLAMRGAEPRRHEYHVAGYHLIIAVVPPLAAENIWQIEGQIRREDDDLSELSGAEVQLLRDDAVVSHDAVDDFGFFALEDIGPGDYTIVIEWATTMILVEKLNIA